MRKVLVSLAIAASALAVAAPASAQYYPQSQGYGYNQGYNNNYGQTRGLQMRIDAVEHRVQRLAERRMIGGRQAGDLINQARQLEYRLRRSSSYGLNQGERYDIERRVARLEQNVRYASNNRYGGYGNGYNGYGQNGYNQGGNGQWEDRDRDGRDDRYEDDQGRQHDDD